MCCLRLHVGVTSQIWFGPEEAAPNVDLYRWRCPPCHENITFQSWHSGVFPCKIIFLIPRFHKIGPAPATTPILFSLPSLISPVWLKISVRWPQTTFWLFDKFVFRGHFIVKSQNLRMFSQRYLLCTLLTTHTHRFWPQDAKQQVKILKKGLNSSLFPLKCKFQKTGQKRRTNAPHKTHVLTFYWQLWTDS